MEVDKKSQFFVKLEIEKKKRIFTSSFSLSHYFLVPTIPIRKKSH